MAILDRVPTKLVDADLLRFAPIEVVRVKDLRRRLMRRSLVAALGALAAGVVLYRGLQEAREHLEELDDDPAGAGLKG